MVVLVSSRTVSGRSCLVVWWPVVPHPSVSSERGARSYSCIDDSFTVGRTPTTRCAVIYCPVGTVHNSTRVQLNRVRSFMSSRHIVESSGGQSIPTHFISARPMRFEHGLRETLFFYIQLAVSRRKMYEMI